MIIRGKYYIVYVTPEFAVANGSFFKNLNDGIGKYFKSEIIGLSSVWLYHFCLFSAINERNAQVLIESVFYN